MQLDDVIKEGSKFIKLDDGETIKLKFFGEFNKKESEEFGVKYEIGVQLQDGSKKVWSGSSNFYDVCRKKAQAAGLSFYDAKFIITRNGVGLDTRYDIGVQGAPVEVENAPENF